MEQEIKEDEYIPNKDKVYPINDVLRRLVMNKIEEKFENSYILYYYMAVQMRLQVKDAQMRTCVTNTHKEISIINLGLHLKGSQDEYLYGIIIMNGIMKQHQYEYLWQIDQFLCSDEIRVKYEFDMVSYPLPTPSQICYFEEDFNKKYVDRLIDNYDYEEWTASDAQDGYRLVIDRAEWIDAFRKSLSSDNSLIPAVINDNDKLEMGRTIIVHIANKDVYVGIQLQQSLLPTTLQEILPIEIVRCIEGYTVALSIIPDPRFICYTSAAACLAKYISLDEINKDGATWARDIKICDFEEELTMVANKYGVDPDHIRNCYDGSSTTRKSFSFAMKQYGINTGRALKIYNELGFTLPEKNDNMELHDFSGDWEQILQQQRISQQQIIDHLKTLDEDDKDTRLLVFGYIRSIKRKIPLEIKSLICGYYTSLKHKHKEDVMRWKSNHSDPTLQIIPSQL